MNPICKAGVASLALLAWHMPAMAQDDSNRSGHFDGPYVGASIGMSVQENDRGDTLVFDTDRDGTFGDTVNTVAPANAFSPGFCNGVAQAPVPSGGCRSDRDGVEYAIRAGYDKRMGNMVIGGLIEASRSKARDATSGFSTTPANYGIERELDYAVSARLRAGYTPGGGALFYVTGGGSYARIDHRFFTTNGANSFDEVRDKKMVWGWQAGGGAEVMVTDNVRLGLEYLYNRYRDNKYKVAVGPGTAGATNPFLLASGGTDLRASDRNFDYHSLRATVAFEF